MPQSTAILTWLAMPANFALARLVAGFGLFSGA